MIITIKPKDKKESEKIQTILNAIEVDFVEEAYDKEIVEKIQKARFEIENGETKKLRSLVYGNRVYQTGRT